MVSAQDYYAFGMAQPGRTYQTSSYRYGFNGKENDNDVKGEGNQQDYGARIYDSRLGRFLSVDPLFKDYPWNSSYAFAENDVIRSIDLDGLEKVQTTFMFNKSSKSVMKVVDADIVLLDANAPRQEVFKFRLNNKLYSANSYNTMLGRDRGKSQLGQFTGVTTLDNEDLMKVVGYASFIIDDKYGGNVEDAMFAESNAIPFTRVKGKELDFKGKAYDLLGIGREQLLEIDGVAYNANEAGNYLWGLALEYKATLISPNGVAEAGSITRGGKWGTNDEPHEQKAISAGRGKAKQLMKDKDFKRKVQEEKLNYRKESKEQNSDAW